MLSRDSCYLGLTLLLQISLCAQVPEKAPATGDAHPQTAESSASSPKNGSLTTWKTVIPDTLRDQKEIYWDFPRNLAHGKHWIPVGTFVTVTTSLIALDQFQSPYFRKTSTYHGFNTALSSRNASLIIAGVPAVTYLTGLIGKNSYAQSTALLTGEAVADSEISAELLKLITRRARPESLPPAGNFADTWLDSNRATSGGFPSGHTIAAFSVATIMSERYGHEHRWVPYCAYGVASAVGFSRVSLSAHNVSDVFAGAVLGYAISRFVVLNRHRGLLPLR